MSKFTPQHPGAWGKARDDLVVAARDIAKIVPVLPARWQAMCDALPGQGGASDPSATRVSGSGQGDDGDPPTSRAAEDQAKARHHAKQIRKHAFELAALLGNYKVRGADTHQRARTAGGDHGCESCARVTIPADGEPNLSGKGLVWHQATKTTVDVDGESKRVCWWCWRWWRNGRGDEPVGVLPPRKAVLEHAKGGRVSKTDWYVQHPPPRKAS